MGTNWVRCEGMIENGLLAVVKRDCLTFVLDAVPSIRSLAAFVRSRCATVTRASFRGRLNPAPMKT